jgi:peptide/nickel transport system ATP-binding protein
MGGVSAEPILALHDVSVRYGRLLALKGVSFAVSPGECFGLVGESGSGKSTALRAIAGLAPVAGGRIAFRGREVGAHRDAAFHRAVQMVFQDPYGSLHPRQTIERQLLEPLLIHRIGERHDRVRAMMGRVGLDQDFLYRYPHQLSGGQRQRVAIARALLMEPSVLLLDEPTSALDVSIQAEILNLLMDLREAGGLTYILVSHDLSVVGTMCDRLLVMRHGEQVEEMSAADLAAERADSRYARDLIAASHGYVRPTGETPR